MKQKDSPWDSGFQASSKPCWSKRSEVISISDSPPPSPLFMYVSFFAVHLDYNKRSILYGDFQCRTSCPQLCIVAIVGTLHCMAY
jgi:hypothetical protein